MATLTIRNLPDDTIDRLKEIAEARGVSMEQEVRDLLEQRYAPRTEVARRIRARWDRLPRTSAANVRSWRDQGRR
ncbi:MAG: FitA-like ribbon-helix-helix domain-containing protein [Myxococcota bacterium]